MTMQRIFLTFFGTGLCPKAPGTAGSLAALLAGLAILYYMGLESLFLLTLVISVVGIFEINRYEKATGTHDQKEIVIDEVAGMWITLMIALSVAAKLQFAYVELIAIVLSFLTFRLFDIWKPSTIGKIDREASGGLGVMGDDLLAGLAGGLLSAVMLIGLSKVL